MMNAVLAYKAGNWVSDDMKFIGTDFIIMNDNINEIYLLGDGFIPKSDKWESLGFRFKKNTGAELIDTVVSLKADEYHGFETVIVNGKEKNLHVFWFD